MNRLIELNSSSFDLPALASEFSARGRLQIRNILTDRSAKAIQSILIEDTPWGLAWQAGSSAPPELIRADRLASMTGDECRSLVGRAAEDGKYGFAFHSYPLVTAYLERWRPGSPQETLLEELNSAEVLGFMRNVTGVSEIVKMDGQATLYAPGHFLRPHNDEESERGRRVAYVLNLTQGKWLAQWGGNLQFFNDAGDVDCAFRPQFNTLNLFRVPQWHSVSEVSAVAPLARYAVTGWARDR